MWNVHPKLTTIVVAQTPRAMFAMVIVSMAYFVIFMKFVPIVILLFWLMMQFTLATYRFYNARKLKKYIDKDNIAKIKKHEIYFIVSNVFQALMWTLASVLAVIYAPQPFELVTFVMIIGIITAAVLSMSSIYKAYLVFFFSMIIPQIAIMLYYGEDQHIALVILSLIYIPSTIILSKTLYYSRLSRIEVNESLAQSVEEYHRLSITDTLTGLYNRRYFFEISQNMISVALREEKEISLLMIDIDYFKKVNDEYGHQVGDSILESFAEGTELLMRESDIFARVGGEEFSILLSDTSNHGARVIAEKIRYAIERKIFSYDGISINITISIGISSLSKEFINIEELYKEADKQLYKAKESGRNRVC